MLVRLREDSPATFADQIVAQVRVGVACGDVRRGERLPTARALAASLGVNMHTVLRAYDALRAVGVLDVRRGQPVVVVGGDRPEEAAVVRAAADLVAAARRAGVADLPSVISGMA